jgi:catechol 2,3-dioxygenase-like lactoylglutathione lyase family enzyme
MATAGFAPAEIVATLAATMPILDHIGLSVADFTRSRDFFDRALAPLDIASVMTFGTITGYGRGPKPDFWIAQGGPDVRITPIHVCFVARSQAEVDAFHAAALAAGGRDNGGPGLRPQYHPGYYGAFVFDPDGNNVEAVFHGQA